MATPSRAAPYPREHRDAPEVLLRKSPQFEPWHLAGRAMFLHPRFVVKSMRMPPLACYTSMIKGGLDPNPGPRPRPVVLLTPEASTFKSLPPILYLIVCC